MTHVHGHVSEKRDHRRSYKRVERNLNSVLDANPYDSLPQVGVLVVFDHQYVVIVTGHIATRTCVGLHQWSPILSIGGECGELFDKWLAA